MVVRAVVEQIDVACIRRRVSQNIKEKSAALPELFAVVLGTDSMVVSTLHALF